LFSARMILINGAGLSELGEAEVRGRVGLTLSALSDSLCLTSSSFA